MSCTLSNWWHLAPQYTFHNYECLEGKTFSFWLTNIICNDCLSTSIASFKLRLQFSKPSYAWRTYMHEVIHICMGCYVWCYTYIHGFIHMHGVIHMNGVIHICMMLYIYAWYYTCICMVLYIYAWCCTYMHGVIHMHDVIHMHGVIHICMVLYMYVCMVLNIYAWCSKYAWWWDDQKFQRFMGGGGTFSFPWCTSKHCY